MSKTTLLVLTAFISLDVNIQITDSAIKVSDYKWESIPKFANISLIADRIKSVATRSEFMCSRECLETTDCVAFVFSKQTKLCHLHSHLNLNTSAVISSLYGNVCMRKHAYKYNANLKKYYFPFLYPIPVKSKAEIACKNIGGTLIILSEEYEFNAMRKILNDTVVDKQNTAFWVGAHRNSKTGHYIWDNGQDVKQSFWVSSQGLTENCVLMMPYMDSKLDAFTCGHSMSRKIYPLCECNILN